MTDSAPAPTPPPAAAPAGGSASTLTHSELVAAYTSGRLRVNIAPKQAAEFLSRRMLLPWVLLPVFGAGVALAIVGHWIIGLIVFLIGLGLRWLTRATAPGYIMQRILADGAFYEEVKGLGFLFVEGH
jgi:hypothetical protein